MNKVQLVFALARFMLPGSRAAASCETTPVRAAPNVTVVNMCPDRNLIAPDGYVRVDPSRLTIAQWQPPDQVQVAALVPAKPETPPVKKLATRKPTQKKTHVVKSFAPSRSIHMGKPSAGRRIAQWLGF